MITLRCSGLDLFRSCRGSIGSDGVLVDAATEAADLGTAFHEAMGLDIRNEAYSAEALAKKHLVDADELGMLLALGRRQWAMLAHHFPEPAFEVEMRYEDGRIILTGHCDLASVVETKD